MKIILAIALFATVAGALLSTKTLVNIDNTIATAKETARPANVKIIKITTPNCADCFNLDSVVADFKKQNINVEDEKTLVLDSPEASAEIMKLGIKKVPTFLVTGENTKSNLESFVESYGEITNDTFVFTKVSPIFIDTKTNKEIGRVEATIITDSSCAKCFDPKLALEGLKKSGVKVVNQKEVAWNSLEGQKIINNYKILKVPSLLLSSDIDLYENIKSSWPNIGSVEEDKTYVLRNLSLPYRDLEKQQILGLVDLIYLVDSSCSDCYKPDVIQKPILKQGYGLGIRSERSVDIASTEGKGLIGKYNITKIPTFILSPDAKLYSNLANDWEGVGTVELDGQFVFREMQSLRGSVYKDLSTNQIVGKAETAPTSIETKE
ncbi:MAG: hypothetical protein COY80_02740 [Candidatus Pacebacteria bacterium CG_4_10_14_0_8_um_filter_42_14]|nr:MAG: hypothetical protein COY80_02740 [Candidatus Pacebacteria bacterium CG_4_10_14_0_8_um_filter_42_14]